jgi:AraC-like DNA-binding protein
MTFLIAERCQERFLPLDLDETRILRERAVIMAGISELRDEYLIERTGAPFHVVVVTHAGHGWVEVADQRHRVSAGDIVSIPAGIDHRYGLDAERWAIVWFHIEPRHRGDVLASARPVVRTAMALPRLLEACEGLLAESSPGSPSHRPAQLYAELVACFLDRELATTGDGPQLQRLRRDLGELWAQVERSLHYPWTVTELARAAHCSPAHLHRLCLRCHGTGPMDLVHRLRMQRAMTLLRQTDEPLKRIAVLVGYRSPFALSAAFKRFLGQSPSAFRASAGA